MLKNKPIGKILVYKLISKEEVKNSFQYSLDKESKCEEYEVIDVKIAPSGVKIYLTNKWNERFEDVQSFSEQLVKEYIKY